MTKSGAYCCGFRLMNEFNFSASVITSSVVGINSGLEAAVCNISLASCINSNRISYGVLLDTILLLNLG